MATAFKRTSTILQFLLITVVVLVGSDLTDDEKKGYFTNTTITSAYIGQMRAYCRPLARASKGALQDIAKVFGEMLTLGSTYVATQTMKDNAVKYTNSCISPLIGPVPMWVALVKWNKDGDFIYPGTKWCGAGNKSTEKERYGSGESTDKCCEIHDNATDYMLAKGYHKKSGLTNPSPYTRTNCSDDIELFNCLYNDSSSLSYEFGQVFFDVVHVHCFAHTYPIVCKKTTGGKCVEYGMNKTQEKKWQFLPPPNFYKAYTRKWFSDNFTVQPDKVDNTWALACREDPDMRCSQYDYVNLTLTVPPLPWKFAA